jgi:hypothetical protein
LDYSAFAVDRLPALAGSPREASMVAKVTAEKVRPVAGVAFASGYMLNESAVAAACSIQPNEVGKDDRIKINSDRAI